MTQVLRISPSGPELANVLEPADGGFIRRVTQYQFPAQETQIIAEGESALGSECIFHVPNDPDVDINKLIWRCHFSVRTASALGCQTSDPLDYGIYLRTNPVGPVWTPIKLGQLYPAYAQTDQQEGTIFQIEATLSRYWNRAVHPLVTASWIAGAEVAARILIRLPVQQTSVNFAVTECHAEIAELYGDVAELMPPII